MHFAMKPSTHPIPPMMFRVATFLLLIAFWSPAHAAEKPQGPNVVIFLADDQGWGDLSFNGNTMLRTPHIDSIARSGASFDRFFVCPVCSPTRAEFFTGRYHPRTGVSGVSTGQERLNLNERTLADAFKAAGYATGAFGKWHNGSQWPYHPNARGFDEYYGFTSGHWGEYFDPPLDHNGHDVRGSGYIADDFTTHAIQFIETNRHRPFLCYVPFNTPHSPWGVPKEDWERFRGSEVSQRGNAPAAENLDETRCVLAMTENLDRNVGRVLARLDQLGLTTNTIVVYFSDNGPNTARWNGGMKGRKGTTDEGGVRSPLFIRWPGKIPSGSKLTGISGAIDLMPTLCALASVPRSTALPIDGLDLSKQLLEGSGALPDRRIFSHWNNNVSVRTAKHRMDTKGALFDMEKDPNQKHDVSAENHAVAEELRTAMSDWRRDVLGPARVQDARPLPVGYREFPITPLPARDGVSHGTVRRSATAPNSSYFVNWTTKEDSITWDIEVATAGVYDVVIDYTCPIADAGSRVELRFGDSAITGTVAPGWDPPLHTNQDTIPRPVGESRMKDFKALNFGAITLKPGRGPLTLKALEIPGTSVMDVRRLKLTLR